MTREREKRLAVKALMLMAVQKRQTYVTVDETRVTKGDTPYIGPNMVFKCQEDSFLREYSAEIVSCKETTYEAIVDGKKAKETGFEIIMTDTILFPEGGGQPCDLGTVNGEPVVQIIRRGADAVHFTKAPLAIGDTVKQVVDWPRRLDHMQQHSGQHLISAIIDREYGFNTDSWWLGEDVSHVELDTATFTTEQIKNVETIVNELIAIAVPVTVSILDPHRTDADGNKIRTRGLPDDHVGDVRVIDIEGVDSNMCCGTHVRNLSQIQVIKLLHAEKGKRKNKTLLYFLCGNRVLQRLDACIAREQAITAIINNGPTQHVAIIDGMSKNVRSTTKSLQNVMKELAILEACKLKSMLTKPKYYLLHKKDGDANFCNTFIRESGNNSIFVVLIVGDKNDGNVTITGDEQHIKDFGSKICDLLGGKGAGKGNRFQGKITKLANVAQVESLLEANFN